MANTKISQLPEYTGSTLGGFMVFNNSGETTTYKYELPVDLGNLGGGSPVSPYGVNSIKLSGETLPNAMSASTNSIFLGTNYSGNTIYGAPGGGVDNSLSVGIGNNVNRVGGNVNYTYMFGKDNANRGGGGFLFKFGELNSTNANSLATQFGYNNNAENGSHQYQFGASNNIGGSYITQFGNSNSGSGIYVHHFGQGNATNNGGYTTLFGQNNNYASPWGFTAGNGNVAEFQYNYTFGYQLWNWTQHSISSGYQNRIVGSSGGEYDVAGFYNGIIGGNNNKIMSEGNRNSFIVSNNSFITGTSENVVMLGTSGRTADQTYCTFVENLKIFNYTNLNYADDTAAAAGGVVLGQLYHNNGALRVRIV